MTSLLASGHLLAGRFELDQPVGSGGMATVYRARDRDSGDWVAVKLLHNQGSKESERFAREAQLLAELRHPGIVSYIAEGKADSGHHFLAMEWLSGEDLGSLLRRGPLPLPSCLTLLDRVAAALSVTHAKGIVHRDLKPSNLFLPEGDIARVKLIDFGIARLFDGATSVTQSGTVLGTPQYMAPEQALGSRELSPAADFFSLGCVLYQCLTGKPPFTADHLAAVLVRILFDEPPPVLQLRPEVPQALLGLIERMLRKPADVHACA